MGWPDSYRMGRSMDSMPLAHASPLIVVLAAPAGSSGAVCLWPAALVQILYHGDPRCAWPFGGLVIFGSCRIDPLPPYCLTGWSPPRRCSIDPRKPPSPLLPLRCQSAVLYLARFDDLANGAPACVGQRLKWRSIYAERAESLKTEPGKMRTPESIHA